MAKNKISVLDVSYPKVLAGLEFRKSNAQDSASHYQNKKRGLRKTKSKITKKSRKLNRGK